MGSKVLCAATALGLTIPYGARNARPAADEPRAAVTTNTSLQEIIVVGCLSKDADGNYILTNARTELPTSTAGTTGTSGTSPTAARAAAPSRQRPVMPTEPAGSGTVKPIWLLSGGTDLDRHIGHKIQAKGRASSSGSTDRSNTPDAAVTAGAAATTPVESLANQTQLDLQSITMIASSCL